MGGASWAMEEIEENAKEVFKGALDVSMVWRDRCICGYWEVRKGDRNILKAWHRHVGGCEG